jgi:antitoxin component of MazEF toxin-antitoxin module
MLRKLSRFGNNLALVIDPSILQLLGIDEGTLLELSTNGKSLIVSPARDVDRRRDFDAALAEVNLQFGKALRRLAG